MPGRADPDNESDQPERPRAPKRHRLLKVAALGGAVALLLNEDVRNHVLDAVFGAEEEFDYSSVTEPPTPATPPDGASPSAPWVRSVESEEPAEAPKDSTDDDDSVEESSAPQANVEAPRATSSISPSPAAWRAAAAEDDRLQQASGSASDSIATPPSPPRDWWSPSARAIDPLDG
jgi:hypothetical protein